MEYRKYDTIEEAEKAAETLESFGFDTEIAVVVAVDPDDASIPAGDGQSVGRDDNGDTDEGETDDEYLPQKSAEGENPKTFQTARFFYKQPEDEWFENTSVADCLSDIFKSAKDAGAVTSSLTKNGVLERTLAREVLDSNDGYYAYRMRADHRHRHGEHYK